MAKCAQVILWDVGGTLVEFACTLPEAVRRRLVRCGIDHSRLSDQHIEQTYTDFIRYEPQWRTLRQEREAETRWFGAMLQDGRLNAESLGHIAAQMPRYFDLYRPVQEMIPLLDELLQHGCPMAVVSNWPPSLPAFLEHHQLLRFFSPVVFSAQDGIHKPDWRIFRRALRALGAQPRNAIFIGDDVARDIEPAKAMGMTAIHFDPRKGNDCCDADNVASLREQLFAIWRR